MNATYFRCAALACFILCVFAAPTFAASWRRQNSETLAWLHSVYFFDANKGFVVGSSGTILKTDDGGAKWTKVASPASDDLRDVFFFDDQNGWILAARSELNLKRGEARAYLLRTTDAGATWRKAEFPNNNLNSQFVRLILSADHQTAWAIGSTGALYAINKTAAAWQPQMPPTDYLLLGGARLSTQQGWLVSAGGTILNTIDAGANWRETTISPSEKTRLNSAFFSNAQTGWTVGAKGKIFANLNRSGWRAQNSGVAADLFDVQFISQTEGWAAGDAGVLLHTTDAGAAWTPQETATGKLNRRLERLFFVQNSLKQIRGWAVGFGGTILGYSN